MESPNSPAQLLNSDWLIHLLSYFDGPDYRRVMDRIRADEVANIRVFPLVASDIERLN